MKKKNENKKYKMGPLVDGTEPLVPLRLDGSEPLVKYRLDGTEPLVKRRLEGPLVPRHLKRIKKKPAKN
jgi:hypothetical protein